jgi:hypothetical protein
MLGKSKHYHHHQIFKETELSKEINKRGKNRDNKKELVSF